MLEIRTEYVISDGGKVVGYVWRKEDPMNYWIARDFEDKTDWVLFKRHIELWQAVQHGIVRRLPPHVPESREGE